MAKRFFLVAGEKVCYSNIVILGFKGQKVIHACMMRLLNLEPAKHGEEQIPNVCGIAGELATSNSKRNFRGHQLGAMENFFRYQPGRQPCLPSCEAWKYEDAL